TMDVEFDEGVGGELIESAIVEMEGRIVEAVPQATRIFIEPVNR
ncbi:MAG: cation transporter, partial [Phycisphaeraceae bacterium]|nr:cation transporter [Phycisphaeraceae bacterium]